MSIAAVRDFIGLWPMNYDLWDLNVAHWSDNRPEAAAVAIGASAWEDTLPALEATTQCLNTENRNAVRAYQQPLKDHAFFTGKVDAVFGKLTREATRQVQTFYELVLTGTPDRVLIDFLLGNEYAQNDVEQTDTLVSLTENVEQALPGETYVVEGHASLRLDRAWTAYSFSPSRAAVGMNRLWPSNRSGYL